jgi:hypothetical protein
MKRKKEKENVDSREIDDIEAGGYAEILEMYTANYLLKSFHVTWHTSIMSLLGLLA